MAINGNEIILLYSGGNSNKNPNLSLGGNPSNFPVFTNKNNLFDNITKEQALEGSTEYRCIYIMNSNLENSLYNARITAESYNLGTTIKLGLFYDTEIQRINLGGNITGGTFTITIEEQNKIITYNSNIITLAAEIQSKIREIEILKDIVVQSSINSSGIKIFNINFIGDANNRSFDLIEITSNDLTGTVMTLTTERVNYGSPINFTAQEINNENIKPSNVDFSNNFVIIGELKPTDIIPLWIERKNIAATESIADDGFKLRITGSPI